MRFVVRSARVPAAALLSLALLAGAAAGDAPALAVGEVTGRTPSGEFSSDLRRALSDELAVTLVPARSRRERYVLSAHLVKLTAEKSQGNVKATAVVSVALRRARDSSLHAILSGKATAEEAANTVDATRDTALRAAVRSALRGLPRAVEAR